MFYQSSFSAATVPINVCLVLSCLDEISKFEIAAAAILNFVRSRTFSSLARYQACVLWKSNVNVKYLKTTIKL